MSYQPFPPTGDPATSQLPPTATAPAGRRRPALIAAGALIAAAGVFAGLMMIVAAGSNYDDGVKNLARAPIGCSTELEFDQTGTFTIYVETVGTVSDLRGDCPNADDKYAYGGRDLPDVDVVLADDDGDEIDVDSDASKDYEAADSVGRSIATVDIDRAGRYVLTVTSDEDDFAIAVGKNPKDAAAGMGAIGLVVIIAGVVIGAVLLVLGLRRRAVSTGGAVPVGYGTAQAYPPVPPSGPAAASSPARPPASPPPPPPHAPPPPPTGGPQWPAPPAGQ